MTDDWIVATQAAVTLLTARLEEIRAGESGIGRELFGELADQPDSMAATRELALGLLSLSSLLVGRLSVATGRTEEEELQRLARWLAQEAEG
jgi:hypothetical protein